MEVSCQLHPPAALLRVPFGQEGWVGSQNRSGRGGVKKNIRARSLY
jgi:hypothetical protein